MPSLLTLPPFQISIPNRCGIIRDRVIVEKEPGAEFIRRIRTVKHPRAGIKARNYMQKVSLGESSDMIDAFHIQVDRCLMTISAFADTRGSEGLSEYLGECRKESPNSMKLDNICVHNVSGKVYGSYTGERVFKIWEFENDERTHALLVTITSETNLSKKVQTQIDNIIKSIRLLHSSNNRHRPPTHL